MAANNLTNDRSFLLDWLEHEDNLFVNRLPFIMVAQSILVAAAVQIFVSDKKNAAFISLAVALAGLAITGTMWLVQVLHVKHIELLQERLRNRNTLYAQIHRELRERRLKIKLWQMIGGKGTKWLQMHIISSVFFLFWLAAMLNSLMWIWQLLRHQT